MVKKQIEIEVCDFCKDSQVVEKCDICGVMCCVRDRINTALDPFGLVICTKHSREHYRAVYQKYLPLLEKLRQGIINELKKVIK